MFENIKKFFKRTNKKETESLKSRDTAKERLHLVLMQDRANVSADFLDLMRQEIIEVIKKYIDIDESAMDVRLTNQAKEDGTQGAPALYANIPILNIKDENKKTKKEPEEEKKKIDEETAEIKEENQIEKIIDNLKENTEKTNEKKNQKTTENNEEETEEANKEREEMKKQEEEKIEEAKKIVEEESTNIGESETNNVDESEENN